MPIPQTKVYLTTALASGRAYKFLPNAAGDFATINNGAPFAPWLGVVNDLNGDGRADFIVGAASDSDKAFEAGRVFIYLGAVAAGSTNQIADSVNAVIIDGVNAGDRAGSAVGSVSDLNGDGLGEILIGAPGMEVGAVSVLFYCLRERELLLNLNERLAGFRFFPSYMRVGGLREDLPRSLHACMNEIYEILRGLCRNDSMEPERLAGELHAHGFRPSFEILGDRTRDGAIRVSWLGIPWRAAFAPGPHVDGVALLGRQPAHHVERIQFVSGEDDFLGVDFPMDAIWRYKADESFLASRSRAHALVALCGWNTGTIIQHRREIA